MASERNERDSLALISADRKLRYLVGPGDKTLKGDITLSPDTLVSRAQGLKNAHAHPYCLQILLPRATPKGVVYYMDAPSPEEMILWIQALQRVIKVRTVC